ncbi:MAG: polyprenyl synthetase family protein, partial [Phycicoccus sp.]
MSAEVTALSLDARRGARPAEETLAEVDVLIESTLADVRDALLEAADTGAGLGAAHDPGPLGVDLVGELADRVRNHGKRLRPVLAHWGWQIGQGDRTTQPDAVRVAAALELLHLFALVQDDVMDRSETRRGRIALHVAAASRHHDAGGLGDSRLFGDSVATLVADLALSEAGLLVSPTAPDVRRAWRLMTVELVEGQLLDVTHTAGRRRDLATSLRIARFKSGRYTITRPLQLGALVAG